MYMKKDKNLISYITIIALENNSDIFQLLIYLSALAYRQYAETKHLSLKIAQDTELTDCSNIRTHQINEILT